MITVKKEEVKKSEFNLKECFILWKNKAKSGLDYLSGKTVDETQVKLIAYYNTNKKNPNEPDIRVYSKNEEGKKDIEVASLWETIGRSDKRYLTGSTNEKEKLVGWYSKLDDEKQPYIRVYYKEDDTNKSDLPF